MKITEIKNLLVKEKVHTESGSSIKCFLLKHPDMSSYLEEFVKVFPCFKKKSEVLSWLQKGIKLKRCQVCGKRIDFVKGKRKEALFCSMECRKTEKGNAMWKDKSKEGLAKKYGNGITNIFQVKEIKEKIKQTNLKKFGVEHTSQRESVKEKSKKTCLMKYGKEYFSQTEEFADKCRNKWFGYIVNKLNAFDLELLTSFEKYHGISQYNSKTNIYHLKCKTCNKEFDYKFNTSKDLSRACPYCHPFYRSKGEEEVCEFVSSLGMNVVPNDRKLLNGNEYPELDILIPDKKVAIEYNGLVWHSENSGKDKNYHLDKTNACLEKGYQLIHIFEDEWRDNKRIVKNRLRNILGCSCGRVFARKCEVREVNNEIARKFLEKYHLQGSINSSIRLGLFYKNRLVALMTFSKPRFNKKYDWELTRYCTIGSFSIIGGAGKLLSYFKGNHSGSIISYADRRWSNGNLYRKLGFKEIGNTKPNYYYVKNGFRYNRMTFQKHKLENNLEIFNKDLTEWQNMCNNGFTQIYDCGNKAFLLWRTLIG